MCKYYLYVNIQLYYIEYILLNILYDVITIYILYSKYYIILYIINIIHM